MAYQNRTTKLKVKLVDSNTGKAVPLNTVASAAYSLFLDSGAITKTLGSGIEKTESHLIVTLNKAELTNVVGEYSHELKVSNQIGDEFGIELSSKTIKFTKTRS